MRAIVFSARSKLKINPAGFAQAYTTVVARPLAGRGNPEDWSEYAYTAAPPFIAGIAAVAMLPRNDDKEYVFAIVNGKEKYYRRLRIIIRFR